jgi:hypothetical protein
VDSLLGTVEAAALTQGLSFLYQQAGELLRRRREAKDRAREPDESLESGEPSVISIPALEAPGSIFVNAPPSAAGNPEALEHNVDNLRAAREALEFAATVRPVEVKSSPQTQAALAQVRTILEEIYGVDLSLVGEQRRHNGPESSHKPSIKTRSLKIKGDFAMRDINKNG